MIQTFRVIIESKNDGNLYYPKLINGSIDSVYPWSCPIANLELQTYFSSRDYINPVRVDDIIRIQVSQNTLPDEKNIYLDIFEGRVVGIDNALGGTISISCRGHDEEIIDAIVDSDYSGSSVTTKTILETLIAAYLSRITDSGSLSTGSTLTSFNVQGWAKTFSDVIHELERIELYDYMFGTNASYDSDGLLSTVHATWEQLSSTPISTLTLVEGTKRIISAAFESSNAHVYNYVKVFGSDPGTQYTGYAEDSTSQGLYGKRTTVITDTNLESNAMCTDIAEGTLERWKDIIVSGVVEIIGHEAVRPGDLVTCKFPSIDVNGSSIDDDYRVKRVSHSIDSDGWITTLSLGEVIPDTQDIIDAYHGRLKGLESNSIS